MPVMEILGYESDFPTPKVKINTDDVSSENYSKSLVD